MNYLSILLKFLTFIPAIAQTVESYAPDAPVETKIQHAQDALTIATSIASAVLPSDQAAIAGEAGAAAQSVLTSTVQAIHAANNPTVTPAPVAVALAV
jgi:hypothetical protein